MFDDARAGDATAHEEAGRGRKHAVYRSYDPQGECICEGRCGNADANAIQRGLWTHTKNGLKSFDRVTNAWSDYSRNLVLRKLFSHVLVLSGAGQSATLDKIKEDIALLKPRTGIPQ